MRNKPPTYQPDFDYSWYSDHAGDDGHKGYRQYFDEDGDCIDTIPIAEIEEEEMYLFHRWLEEQREAAEAEGKIFLSKIEYEMRGYSSAYLKRIKFPHDPMLIPNWLPRGGNMMLYGKPETGKSILGVTLAKAIAEGSPFLDFETSQGVAVYVQMDMSVSVAHDRVVSHAEDIPNNNLHFILGTMRNCIMQHTTKVPWVEYVNEVQPDLIIFDTLRALHNLNENDSDVPRKVIKKCRDLLGSEATFVFIHHMRKDQPDQMNYLEDFRGSSAWLADMDTVLKLTGVKTVKKKVTFAKTRTCESIDNKACWLNPQKLLLETVNPDLLEAGVELRGQIGAKELIEELQRLNVPKEQWAKSLMAAGFGRSYAYEVVGKFR